MAEGWFSFLTTNKAKLAAIRAVEMVLRVITGTRLSITATLEQNPVQQLRIKSKVEQKLSVMESIKTKLVEMAQRVTEIGTRSAEMALKDADTGIRLHAMASTKTRRDILRLN